MDELSQKLNSILSDPESMANLKEMAQNLLGKNEETPKTEQSDMLGIDMASLMSVIGKLKSRGVSENEKLLIALKPHLSKERQARVDTAVKILKLLELAPVIKETNLLGGLL